MGIKCLLKFLSTYKDLVITKDIGDYKGKTVAIDISILIYQVVISMRNTGSDLLNNDGLLSSHILGLFNKTIHMLERGIMPVYVFDGKPPLLKSKILDARKQVKQKAFEKMDTAQSVEEKIKYFKRTVSIGKEQMEQCKELLDLMGIPYIIAPEEADSQLAWLCKNKLVDAVLTEDMDILTFGSPCIIRNLASITKKPIEINLAKVLKTLELTQEQFIDLCMLFGCDYCPGVYDAPQEKIYSTYKKHLSINKTLTDLKEQGYHIPIYDESMYSTAKQYFQNLVHKDIKTEELTMKKPKTEELMELLIDKWSFIKYKVVNKLKRLEKCYKS